MNILPRFLYLFQTLPIEVSKQYFIEWDRLISRFIWQERKPRIKFKTLQLQKEEGGFALPCLKEYYHAAQLRPLLCICNPDFRARWKDIENDNLKRPPIEALMADEHLTKIYIKELNPWTSNLLKIWQGIIIIKKSNLLESVTILRWPAYDSTFPPNTIDGSFKAWTKQGLIAYRTFLHKGSVGF